MAPTRDRESTATDNMHWHPSNIHTIIVIYVIMYIIICLHIQTGGGTQSMLSRPEYAVVCVVKSNRNVLLPDCATYTQKHFGEV